MPVQRFIWSFRPCSAATHALANSSPVFAIPKGDYACIGQPFTLDFSAKDADGDSLTYTLVTPYNGFSTPNDAKPGLAKRSCTTTLPPGLIRP